MPRYSKSHSTNAVNGLFSPELIEETFQGPL